MYYGKNGKYPETYHFILIVSLDCSPLFLPEPKMKTRSQTTPRRRRQQHDASPSRRSSSSMTAAAVEPRQPRPLVTVTAVPTGPQAPFSNPDLEFTVYEGSCIELRGPSGRGTLLLLWFGAVDCVVVWGCLHFSFVRSFLLAGGKPHSLSFRCLSNHSSSCCCCFVARMTWDI